MLSRLKEVAAFRQFWFVTATPYGKDIEPYVTNKKEILYAVRQLLAMIGPKAVAWRYDPIFITEKYSFEYHIKSFSKMAEMLCRWVSFCVISFIDLYEKTKRNFPQARAVTELEQKQIAKAFAAIGACYGIFVRTCCENDSLKQCGVDTSGCMTKTILEIATECQLSVPRKKRSLRGACDCLLGNDIEMYHTCLHGCRYCYANVDHTTVERNVRLHDPTSPFLIGGSRKEDRIYQVQQKSYVDTQMHFFDL